MKDEYPDSKSDLFAAFIERCAGLARQFGAAAMITMQSWMFLSSYEKLRASLLTHQQITSMLHLGARAFDSIGGEVVSSTAFVLTNLPSESRRATPERPGTFIRLVDGMSEAEKTTALRIALAERTQETGYHLASGPDFAAIPGSPIVYWLSEKMRAAFDESTSLGVYSQPREGLTTTDNARFKRAWWEVSLADMAFGQQARTASHGKRWFPMNDGGAYRKWYGNLETVINWENNGEALKAFIVEKVGAHWSKQIRSDRWYLLPSVAVGKITSSEPSFRIYCDGYIPDSAAKFLCAETESEQLALAGYLNSSTVTELLRAMAPTLNVTGQALSSLPYQVGEGMVSGVRSLREASAADWDSVETSWNFERNPLVALS